MNISGIRSISRDHELELNMFITLRGDLEDSAADELDPLIELAGGEYEVEVGEVNHDFDQEP
jgi:hypothetical protein